MIDPLFPDPVISVVASDEMWDAPLHPDESARLVRAVEKRRREFAAGRACARRGLEALGIRGAVLPSRSDRTPAWPADAVGSISHCDGFCAAVVALREDVVSLGLDVECRGRVGPDLVPRILCEEERAALAGLPDGARADWASIFFSAKEAFYKCYFPLTGTFLEFHDVVLQVDPEAGAFEARLVREDAPSIGGLRGLRGRFASDAERVYTGVSLLPGEVGDDRTP
jgi:4'-phosphopantetheinyl transferase EntD